MANYKVFFCIVALLAIFALASAQQHEAKKRYDGHQVLRVLVRDEQQAKTVNDFVEQNLIDVWSHRLVLGRSFDINVPPHLLASFKSLGIDFEVWIEDLQKAIDQEAAAQDSALKASGSDSNSFFLAYQQFDQIQSFVQSLVANYSSVAEYIEIGKTIEGRPIFGVVVGGASSASKPGFVFNGCQHAREWISPMTVTYMLYQIVTQYESNPTLSAFSWTVIPVVNGDGYVYTQTDRMWRKNRRKTGICYGVDINRNWNNHWNEGGSSSNPCSETYCGPSAFSEPEETAVADYLTNATNVQAYIDFHSYSQLWMTPWGWTQTQPTDYATQIDGANIAVKALSALFGTQYTTGTIYSTIYEATGSSVDYAYGNANVKYSYAVELRDTGEYGFLLPPSEILPSGEETYAGLVALAQYVQSQL